jgi:hypothetical protein
MQRSAQVIKCAILMVAFVMTGCATVPIAQDGAPLTSTQGLLAFRITSNVKGALRYINYSATSTVGSRLSEDVFGSKGMVGLEVGDKYYLVPFEAGEYMWSHLDVYPKYAWLQSTNRFRVRPQAITYIGHIELTSRTTDFSLKAFDREDDMLGFLAKSYPTYFGTYVVYKEIAVIRLR